MRLEAQAPGEQACQSAFVVQRFRNVSADALDLRVDALKPARPELQCFVTAKLKMARLPVVARPLWHVRAGQCLDDTSGLGLQGLTVLQAHR